MATKITKDTTIQEALALGDSAFEMLSRYLGPGCLGCGAAAFETIEMGLISHGQSEAKIPELVAELQKLANKPVGTTVAKKEEIQTPK